MKTVVSFICILLTASFAPLHAASDTFVDYQNYNHGYCPTCNCYPCQCSGEGGDEGDLPPDGSAGAPPGAPQPPCQPKTPCNEPAPVCATNCGISLCWIGLAIAVIATAAAIIVSSNNGSDPSH